MNMMVATDFVIGVTLAIFRASETISVSAILFIVCVSLVHIPVATYLMGATGGNIGFNVFDQNF